MTRQSAPESPPAPPALSLSGRAALVTGGSRGIGAATARMLAGAGARVAITYRSREAEAARVVEACRLAAGDAFALQVDLSSPEAAEGAVTAARERFGALDVFVANAGIWVADEVPLTEMDPEQWRRTMAVNLDAVFHGCRAALRVMAGDRSEGSGGRIVVVSSTAGRRGEAFHADYAASKGAVLALVKSLCVEAAPHGVTVNSVAPGWVDTEMVSERFARRGGRGRTEIEEEIPLGRVAAPEDVAGPIVFLCSDLARHITGEVLDVNGGAVLG